MLRLGITSPCRLISSSVSIRLTRTALQGNGRYSLSLGVCTGSPPYPIRLPQHHRSFFYGARRPVVYHHNQLATTGQYSSVALVGSPAHKPQQQQRQQQLRRRLSASRGLDALGRSDRRGRKGRSSTPDDYIDDDDDDNDHTDAMPGYSLARVYADANNNRPDEYWDYENLTIEWVRD